MLSFNTNYLEHYCCWEILNLTEEEKDEIVESQKLSARDKKEISQGACVNCGIVMVIVTTFMTLAALFL